MYLCIASAAQIESLKRDSIGFQYIEQINTHDLYPNEIRDIVKRLDSELRFNTLFYTLNRTILDMVGPQDHKVFDYDDVYIVVSGNLKFLTDYVDPNYLAHFALGDLLESGELKI